MPYTSYLLKQRGKHRRFDPETRAELAFRFKALYRNLGWDQATCAKNLHITLRTLHNWESGKHDIPFAAYKLLRLLNRMELPGESWAGWCFVGGVLYSPENRPFQGTDSSWWGLLIRRAAMFDDLYQRLHGGKGAQGPVPGVGCPIGRPTGGAGRGATDTPAPAGGRREAPAPNLLIVNFRTTPPPFGAPAGSYAIKPIAESTSIKLVATNHHTVKGVA